MNASNRPLGLQNKILFVVLLVASISIPLSAHAGSAVYVYDSLGRLSQINYDTGAVLKYSYDAMGNRTMEFVAGTRVLSPEARAALMSIIMQMLLDD